MLFVTGHLQILYVPPFSTLKLSPLLFEVLNDFTQWWASKGILPPLAPAEVLFQ
jgi:hypothetical protein